MQVSKKTSALVFLLRAAGISAFKFSFVGIYCSRWIKLQIFVATSCSTVHKVALWRLLWHLLFHYLLKWKSMLFLQIIVCEIMEKEKLDHYSSKVFSECFFFLLQSYFMNSFRLTSFGPSSRWLCCFSFWYWGFISSYCVLDLS